MCTLASQMFVLLTLLLALGSPSQAASEAWLEAIPEGVLEPEVPSDNPMS